MATARYVVGVILLMSLPPGVLLWFAIHPFVRFWRRLRAKWTYVILTPFVVAWMYGAFLLRDVLLGADLGTHFLLLLPAAACVAMGTWVAVLRRRQLTTRILTGLPELSPTTHPGKLLTVGIYAKIRHPRYIEVMLFTTAYALFANYLGSYVATGLAVPALYLTVVLEEKELRDRFGPDYEEYCRHVPRFIPSRGTRSK